MISAVFALAVLAAAADPATPAPANSAAPPAKAAKSGAAPDGLVCKKEPVLGSRMKQRVCLSQVEWDQRKATARDDLDAAQRNRPLQSN